MKQYSVYFINLDPTIGSEYKKTRPCLIVSPDVMNKYLRTVMIAPLTTKSHPYPSRVFLKFKGKSAYICLDQIRNVDKNRLIKKLGNTTQPITEKVKAVIKEMLVD